MRNILMITAFLACSVSLYADEWMSVLDNNRENGYVQYGTDPVRNNGDIPVFYRTSVDGEQHIGGKTFKGVCVYRTMAKDYPQNLAYMREDGGKVYAVYNEKYCAPDGYYEPGKEYLLYDFNMKAGESLTLEPRSAGEESIVLKCIETGLTETKYGTRRFLKFDRNVNPTTRRWMAYEYLVEGIGPVGNCNSAVPYRLTETSGGSESPQATTIDMLYQREVSVKDYATYTEMVWTLPAFEVWAVHDPSVWCFQTKDTYGASVEEVEMPAMPDKSISLVTRDGCDIVTSSNGEIKEVAVFDVLGKELAHYAPNSNEFRINLTGFDTRIIIVRVSTASSSRSFKCIR